MHFRTLFSSLCIFALLNVCHTDGQDNYKIPDLNPARLGRASDTKPSFEPARISDIQSKPAKSSIQKNDLRGSFGDSAPQEQDAKLPPSRSFDSQPRPPAPRSFSTVGNRNSNLGNQNPMKLLDADQIVPQIQHSQDSQVLPTITAAQTRPAATHRIPDALPPLNTNSVMATNISSTMSGVNNVRPTNYDSPQSGQVVQSNSQPISNVQTARKILERYDVSSNTSPLPGVPLALEDMMQTTPLRYRMAMVQKYWETYFDWATLQNRLMYSNWLNQVQSPRSISEQTMLQTAKSMALNDVTAAEIQLSKSQAKLQQLAQSRTQDLLPLPLNQPLVTKYNSHYDWYAARNLIPAKLKGVNEMLPRTYELLIRRAMTVGQAENARNQTNQEFVGGRSSIANLLESGRTWQASLQGFVGTVVNYNHAISDYALTITPPQKPIDQVVAMLVAKPKSINELAKINSVMERRIGQQQNLQNQRQAAFASSRSNQQANGSVAGNRNLTRTANNDPFKSANSNPSANRALPPINSTRQPAAQPGTLPLRNQSETAQIQAQPQNANPAFRQPDRRGRNVNNGQQPAGGAAQQFKSGGGGFAPSKNNNSFAGNGGGSFGD